MKDKIVATLEMSDKEIKFEFDNITHNSFRIIKKIDDPITMMSHYEGVGDMIHLVTSNMPTELNDEIIKMIKKYCNI
jgi:hypothetical protein